MPWFDVTHHLLRALVLLWFGVVGACVGSFLNVVVYRLPAGLNLLRPGSRCPFCAVSIAPRDNIPILSWFLLRGRCRHCHLPIATRYPTVEFCVAVLFVLLAAAWLPSRSFYYRVDGTIVSQWLALVSCLVLIGTWIPAALIENDGQHVPSRLLVPLVAVAAIHGARVTFHFTWQWGSILRAAEPESPSSLLGGIVAALLAAVVTGPSALVGSITWATLLVATASLLGINGFVAIWLLAALGRLVSSGVRPAHRACHGPNTRGEIVDADRPTWTWLGCFRRTTGGLAVWTMATLAWSVASGVASADEEMVGRLVRIASLPASMDGSWVLAVGGSAILVSLLTDWWRPGQSHA